MDVARIRKDTPACEHQLFVNSAGSSLPPSAVNEAINTYLREEAEIGGYGYMTERALDISSFYTEAARLLNCTERNIAFASSATDGYAKALSSLLLKPGDVVLTSDDDYVSNYIQFINLEQRTGIKVERMALLDNGDLDLAAIAQQMDKLNPALVALTHVPTNSGLVQDARSIGLLCKERDITYLLDACQSVGQMQVDVKNLHCDFLSVTGRKFLRGPRGTGLLYVSDRILDKGLKPMAMDAADAVWTSPLEYTLGATAKRFEFWEKSYALVMGLTAAMSYANEIGMQAIEAQNSRLSQGLRRDLINIKGVQLYDRGSKTCSIITLRKSGVDQSRIAAVLDEAHVRYGISQRAHAVIDYDKKGIDWILRLSPHYFNTPQELQELTRLIDSM